LAECVDCNKRGPRFQIHQRSDRSGPIARYTEGEIFFTAIVISPLKSPSMKPSITSVPQLYRNAMRWTEIASVLSKYGLANWMSRFNIDFISERLKSPDGEKLNSLTHPNRVRLAMTELGSTFIKFGQLLGTRPDLIGTEMANELSRLQSAAPADDFEKVKETIEAEQRRVLEELFHEFDPTPIASASIGQAHRATIKACDHPAYAHLAGENKELIDVVVKVQHHGIDRILEADLDILAGLAQLAERIDDFRNYLLVSSGT